MERQVFRIIAWRGKYWEESENLPAEKRKRENSL